jgi:hypothetical protein
MEEVRMLRAKLRAAQRRLALVVNDMLPENEKLNQCELARLFTCDEKSVRRDRAAVAKLAGQLLLVSQRKDQRCLLCGGVCNE